MGDIGFFSLAGFKLSSIVEVVIYFCLFAFWARRYEAQLPLWRIAVGMIVGTSIINLPIILFLMIIRKASYCKFWI